MNKKVVFVFSGTGDDKATHAKAPYNDDVVRVFVKGCQDEHVGGANAFSTAGRMINPNLEVGARNVSKAFQGKTLNLSDLRSNLGSAIVSIDGLGKDEENASFQVDEVCLMGFSRGGVTAFATAKELDKHGIPIHIIANQPVPGERSEKGKSYQKHYDLSECENIQNATTLLGSYDLNNNFLENKYFLQMVAKFNEKICKVNNILLPHQDHFNFMKLDLVKNRVNLALKEIGFVTEEGDTYESRIEDFYLNQDLIAYTPEKFRQKILGSKDQAINQDPIFLKSQKFIVDEKLGALGLKIDESSLDVNNKVSAILSIIKIAEMKTDIIYIEDSEKNKVKEQIKLVLEDSESGKDFRDLVNETNNVCDYLTVITNEAKIFCTDTISTEIRNDSKYDNAYIWVKEKQLLYYKAEGAPFKKLNFNESRSEELKLYFNTEFEKSSKRILHFDNFMESVLKRDISNEYKRTHKSGKIEKEGIEFKKTVYSAGYKFFNIKTPTESEKLEFIASYKTAEKEYRKNAVDIDKIKWRRALKYLVNTISHITGIGLLFNVYHKLKTGNWTLLNKKKEDKILKATSKKLQKIERKRDIVKTKSFRDELAQDRALEKETKKPSESTSSNLKLNN